jgi:hypothetical protein
MSYADNPPDGWPFPTWKGKPIKRPKPKKPAYPDAPDAPF